ncbi:MAG: hypothetical protein PVI86_10125 [Phycisphaerae bacterium]|jgi:hypothetical protein
MIAEKSPRAGERRGQDERNETTGIVAGRFPTCKLRGCQIVSSFPDGCPLGVLDVHGRLSETQNRGWRQLTDSSTEDHRGGLTLLDICDTCSDCAGRLLPHRHVRFLRERIGCDG